MSGAGRLSNMSEQAKISILFWASGAVLVGGVLLLNFSIPTAIVIAGVMGIAASCAWFISYIRELP